MKLNLAQKPAKKYQGILIAALVFLFLLAGGVYLFASRKESTQTMAVFPVQRGPLTISVLQSGTIKAKDQIIIKNEVEGRTSIIYLIEEGTRVKAGDLLVELDASSLVDAKIGQEIQVQNAEAAFVNARENLEVVRNQAESDKDAALLTLEFAREDLKQYKEGEYPNLLRDAEAKIKLAEEELERAQDTLAWSQKLWEEKYISENELKADQLAVTRRKLDLELAISSRDLLQNFTYLRRVKQLESDIRQAEMAYERTVRKANASVVQAEAELKARQAEYNQQKDRLAKLEDQLRKTKLYAPADGLVIYATSAQRGGFRGGQEPLMEGQEVHERQELIYLPLGYSAIAEVNVHEASLKKVHPGLPVVITVDALPGRRFMGKVDSIAPLPDAQSMWMNPDLKVYNTQISIEGEEPALRTGMSCKAEIIVAHYEDALYIPIQSVIQVGGQPTVYVLTGSAIEARPVKVGLDNNRMIHILEGLKEGEKVLLNPPLKEAEAPAAGFSSVQTDGQVSQEIRQRLEDAGRVQPSAADPQQGGTENQGSRRRTRPETQDASSPTRDSMRRRFENMTPEQREEMRRRFESMTPEQREEMRRRFEQARPQEQPSDEQNRSSQEPQAGSSGEGRP
ncbi:MAG TPA: efflux RND transporter periplasmic adaptor subunit [Anaerohalosphaeraceae bacterium]|nr:efflux RND transporter periplasmic adaptor subunit [Anaerohalosphaeraceae bacterium]